MKLGKAELPHTFLLDIDGCILKHQGTISRMITELPVATKEAIEAIDHLISKGHIIILTTGRPASCKKQTKKQLRLLGISYHQLVMGVGIGARVIVNDLRPGDDNPTAAAICLTRDEGLSTLMKEF